jgi:hypothetical protein
MFSSKKIAFGFCAAVLVIGAASVLTFGHEPTAPIYLSYAGVSSSSNSNWISIVISNPSPAAIVYLVRDPEFKSNGFWASIPFPTGMRMDLLPPGQSASRVVLAPSGGAEARVPVLWGFRSSSTPSKPSVWRQLGNDAIAFLRMHDFRGSGALYTNYVEGIQLK